MIGTMSPVLPGLLFFLTFLTVTVLTMKLDSVGAEGPGDLKDSRPLSVQILSPFF